MTCGWLRFLVLFVAWVNPARAAGGNAKSPCNCNAALVQVRADVGADGPINCNCIGGSYRHSVTPRDELLGMGMGALNNHLFSCQRKLEGLQQERDHAVAAGATQAEKADDSVKLMEKGLAKLRNTSAKDRQEVLAEKQKLQAAIKNAQGNLTNLKQEYNKAFSQWYGLKTAMSKKLLAVKQCKCSGGAKQSFLQRGSQRLIGSTVVGDDTSLQTLAQDYPTPEAHEKVREIEACEGNVVQTADEIEAAQAKAAKSAASSSTKLAVLKKRMFEQQHMDKVLSQTSQVRALRSTSAAMEEAVRHEEQQVDVYKGKVDELKKSLGKLTEEMKTCQCATL